MIKVTPDKLQPGMRLAKPVMNRAGMALLGEGTELTETWVARIQDMELEGAIYVEGKLEMEVPMDEMVAALEKRFQSAHGNPRMEMIKRAAEKHIRTLYE
jgi:ribosomal protein S13